MLPPQKYFDFDNFWLCKSRILFWNDGVNNFWPWSVARAIGGYFWPQLLKFFEAKIWYFFKLCWKKTSTCQHHFAECQLTECHSANGNWTDLTRSITNLKRFSIYKAHCPSSLTRLTALGHSLPIWLWLSVTFTSISQLTVLANQMSEHSMLEKWASAKWVLAKWLSVKSQSAKRRGFLLISFNVK